MRRSFVSLSRLTTSRSSPSGSLSLTLTKLPTIQVSNHCHHDLGSLVLSCSLVRRGAAEFTFAFPEYIEGLDSMTISLSLQELAALTRTCRRSGSLRSFVVIFCLNSHLSFCYLSGDSVLRVLKAAVTRSAGIDVSQLALSRCGTPKAFLAHDGKLKVQYMCP